MRRKRSKLEVSTFPFLAVLLCAMGSLMLLLFIMDRRAKIAAQYRTAEAMEERQARTKAEEDARQAEWEKAKEQLHLSLLEQQNQLVAEAKDLDQSKDDASKKLAAIQARDDALQEQAKGEAAKISLLQLDIENQQAGVQQVAKKETMSKAELIEAAKELAELEKAFRQLRALRERDKEVYSLVPYRGKRGDLRPPIYVECVRDGVMFHPDKKFLERWEFTPGSIRGEIEHRFGPLAVQQAAKEKGQPLAEEPKGPYVLFLVRPDGIASYYKAQAALNGFQLDFGYELIDAGWALDFSGESHARNAPGRKPVPRDTAPSPIAAPALPLFNGPPSGVPIAQGMLPAPPGANGSAPGGQGGPFSSNRLPGGTSAGTSGLGASGVGLTGPILPPTGYAGGVAGGSLGSSVDKGNFGSGKDLVPAPGLKGNQAPGGTDAGAPSKGPSFVPIPKTAPPASVASAGLRPDPILGIGNPNASGKTAPLGAGQPTSPAGASGNPSGGGSTPNLDPINVPIPGNNVSTPRTGTGASGANSSDANASASNGPPGGSASTDPRGSTTDNVPGATGGASTDPTVRPLPTFGGEREKKPAPAATPLSKLLGNKDFIITIACHSDYVTITPGAWSYRWNASDLESTDRAFVRAVTTLIERRQASVRPGEPPYRPMIRFQVPSEGLRTLYHVHPLLEPLRVPMTRENIAESR